MFHNEHATPIAPMQVQVLQDLWRTHPLIIAPVVKNHLHDIGISRGNTDKHVAGNMPATIADMKSLSPERLWIFYHTGSFRHGAHEVRILNQQLAQKMTLPATDVT
jgi:hypothetical protein